MMKPSRSRELILAFAFASIGAGTREYRRQHRVDWNGLHRLSVHGDVR
jgi:hypothetical protein